MIIVIALCAATLFIASNFGTKEYAQENNTLILEDMRAIMRDEQRDIASIRNTSSAEVEALTQMAMSSSSQYKEPILHSVFFSWVLVW
jgi:hypothetical protein